MIEGVILLKKKLAKPQWNHVLRTGVQRLNMC